MGSTVLSIQRLPDHGTDLPLDVGVQLDVTGDGHRGFKGKDDGVFYSS
jgi:hypothetical protein